jgi:hypothetical protein
MDENVIEYLSGSSGTQKIDQWQSIQELSEIREVVYSSSSTQNNQICWGCLPIIEGGEMHHETL